MHPETSTFTEGWFELKVSVHLKRQLYNLLIIILLLAPSLQAQSRRDSLRNLLQETRGLQRARLLYELSLQTRQNNIEKAITQVKKALSIAKRWEDEELQSDFHRQLGWYYSIVERDTTALEHYLLALQIERRHGHRLEEANVLHSLGRFYMEQGNYAQALNNFLQALRIWQDEGEKKDAAITLQYIGELYLRQDKFQKSVSFYRQSYEMNKAINNYSQMSMAAAGTAFALQKLKKYDEAISYFKQAFEAAKKINSIYRIHAKTGILIGMSSVYRDKKLFDKALSLLHRQLEIAKNHESKLLQARGFINLADLSKTTGNLERSNQYLKEAILLKSEAGFPTNTSLNKLAQNYLAQAQGNKAIHTAMKALVQTKESGTLEEKKAILETLMQAYIELGNYQEALIYQERLMTVKEKIFNEVKSQQIAEMQVRYATRQKEQEIALLQKKQENAELLRNALIIGLALIIIIAFLIYKRQRLKIKKNKTDLENTRLKEQQLKQDIEFKNKQLTTHSLNLVQKNEVMKELKQNIAQIQKKSNGSVDKKLRSLQNLVNYSFNLDKDWEDFRHYFEEVHTGFFESLKKQCPSLTSNELRLSALVKLNLTIKEIATIMNISPDSVKTARYRLRKKLNMDTDEDLSEYMMNVEKQVAE